MTERGILVHEDSLTHFGVKGMRWGKRSSSGGSDKAPSKGKQRDTAIKEARSNLSDSGRKAINAEEKYYAAKTDRSRKIAEKALDKAGTEYMSTLATSMQKTRGEKITAGLAITGVAIATLAPTALKVAGR